MACSYTLAQDRFDWGARDGTPAAALLPSSSSVETSGTGRRGRKEGAGSQRPPAAEILAVVRHADAISSRRVARRRLVLMVRACSCLSGPHARRGMGEFDAAPPIAVPMDSSAGKKMVRLWSGGSRRWEEMHGEGARDWWGNNADEGWPSACSLRFLVVGSEVCRRLRSYSCVVIRRRWVGSTVSSRSSSH
jgi:hypothetical protein